MRKRIGIFGGSFNPIHVAHLVLADRAAEVLRLERVIFVPAKLPPHKESSELAPAADRLEMVRLAVKGNRHFAVSDIELRREGPSYSVDTVAAMRGRLGREAEIYFLIGADTVAELPTWHDARRLAKLCKFVPLSRPGARLPSVASLGATLGRREARGILSRVIEMPLLGISSSDIRDRVATGQSIRYLVPGAAANYLRRRRLYSS